MKTFHIKAEGQFCSLKVEEKCGEANCSHPKVEGKCSIERAFLKQNQIFKQFISRKALDGLIPSWNKLQLDSDAELLCKSLKSWANKWNLTDDWCLDFALDCLKIFKTEKLDKIDFENINIQTFDDLQLIYFSHSLNPKDGWQGALFDLRWHKRKDKYLDYLLDDKVSPFTFDWYAIQINITWFPLLQGREGFQREAESQFWSKLNLMLTENKEFFAGRLEELSKTLSRFQKQLNKYITGLLERYENSTVKTPIKEYGDRDFQWLIEYQIPPFKSYGKIAAKFDVDSKTAYGAVNNVAERWI